MHLRGLFPGPTDTVPINRSHAASPCEPRQTIEVDVFLISLHPYRLIRHLTLVLHQLSQLARLLLHEHVPTLYIQGDELFPNMQRRGSRTNLEVGISVVIDRALLNLDPHR